MKHPELIHNSIYQLGRRAAKVVDEVGYLFMLFWECLTWTFIGFTRKQPVRVNAVVKEALHIGIYALVIIGILCMAVGTMLAIHTLELAKKFGVESQVILAIARSMTQEFSPLIVAILVAGRSGSAITARIGSMMESQEIDALRVIGINPIRFLAAPIFIGMVVIVPCLTIWGDLAGILGGALYSVGELKMSLGVYLERSLSVLQVQDIWKGLVKSVMFAVLIALISLSQGFQAKGGAEGVGRATTRSVVIAICAVIITDMIFTYFLVRI